MATAGPIPPPPPPEPAPGPPPAPVAPWGGLRLACLGSLSVLIAFIALRAPRLIGEWQALRGEQARDRYTRVIGYPGIHPLPSLAAPPRDWFREEGSDALLWSGWAPALGRHGWFRFDRGELERGRLSGGLGRDVVRAIDRPLVEVGGGPFWGRIPYDAPVAGIEWEGSALAYPLRVLERVEVVNDRVGDRPLLVVFTPFDPPDRAVRAYEPVVAGRRITLGTSGYFHDRRPLLYDRGTESFWKADDGGLVAIAGALRGARLRTVARPALATWDDWRSRFPASRLLVGADRSGPRPER